MSAKIILWQGLPAVQLKNDAAECTITLHGAHVVSYIPSGMKELLFVSSCSEFADGKAIRGGVPLCFPWFGAPPAGETRSHGLVRTREWELLEADSERAVFGIEVKGFRLRYTVIAGDKLDLFLHIENISADVQTYSGALHTYFQVSNVSDLTLDGVLGLSYLDSLTGKDEIQQSPLQINCEVDRVYRSSGEVILHDPGLKRQIKIAKSGSNSTVIWNPWIAKSQRMADFGDSEYPGMICVEAANVADVNDARTLAPGECAGVGQIISVQNY